MVAIEKIEQVLKSFVRYYNIKREDVTPPFFAEAEFISHNEQYYLVKAAKVADIDSNEYVFFAVEERLTLDKLLELDKTAWETGMSRVKPYYGHKNSDVTLVIIADHIDQDAFLKVKKLKHSKSYKFSLYGYSNYKLIAMDTSLDRLTYNRQGQPLKKILNNKN